MSHWFQQWPICCIQTRYTKQNDDVSIISNIKRTFEVFYTNFHNVLLLKECIKYPRNFCRNMHLVKEYDEKYNFGNKNKFESFSPNCFFLSFSRKELERNCRIIKFLSVFVCELKMYLQQQEVKEIEIFNWKEFFCIRKQKNWKIIFI